MNPLRIALLAGATGLVGRELLAGLLADPAVAAVHTLGRPPLGTAPPQLTHHVGALSAFPPERGRRSPRRGSVSAA